MPHCRRRGRRHICSPGPLYARPPWTEFQMKATSADTGRRCRFRARRKLSISPADAAVDRKQARLVELGLSNKQGRVLAVVIAQSETEQFPAPDSSCEQENNRKPNHFGAERRGRRPRQAGSRTEEPRYFPSPVDDL